MSNQRGIAQLFIIVLLFFGIGLGVYLTQFTQIFIPKAAETDTETRAIALNNVEKTVVDSNATSYGTYSSHNQRIASNQHGIFMTYLHYINYASTESLKDSVWRLARSTDGGKTFSTIYESTNGTTAPSIETDDGGNIFLIHSDYKTGSAKFYRFASSANFRNPAITTIPNMGIVGKFTMEIDLNRRQLYYFSQYGKFITLDFAGVIISDYNLIQHGPNAWTQYPYLYLDSDGTLYAAWTNLTKLRGTPKEYNEDKNSLGLLPKYRSIHFAVSKDSGKTWKKTNGQSLSTPIIADETGPADMVNISNIEFGGLWLANMIVKNGKAHFFYKTNMRYTQNPVSEDRYQHIRFDLASGRKDKQVSPEVKGDSISLMDATAYFVTSRTSNDLYLVSKSGSSLAVLKSTDNGSTWQDFALGNQISEGTYAISGSPQLTNDGYILGSFTQSGNFDDRSLPVKVNFFKVNTNTTPQVSPSPSATSQPTSTPIISPSVSPAPTSTLKPEKLGDLNNDGTVNTLDFALLLSKWNTADPTADLNGDGTVGLVDFSILLSNWST